MSKTSGETIKFWRAQKGLSQKALAELIFIEQPTLSNYENGKTQIPIDVRLKIASYFRKDIKEIFPEIFDATGANNATINNTDFLTNNDNAVITAITELTREVKQLADRLNGSI